MKAFMLAFLDSNQNKSTCPEQATSITAGKNKE
jgi:hypothetical protein